MASSLAPRLPGSPRKGVAMRGEGLCNKVAHDSARAFGQVLERALEIVGWTQARLALELGYSEENRASVSRWVNGTEAPPIARLWAVKPLRYGLLVAQAEAAQDGRIKLQAVVTVEMSA